MDVLFSDASFSATTCQIKPLSDAGKAWFAERFGAIANGVILRKSGAYEAMEAITKAGLSYGVQTLPLFEGN